MKISTFSLGLCLFWIYYGLFYLFFKPVHEFYPVIDPKSLLWWQQQFLFRDGIESPLMLIGSFVYLGVAFVVFKNKTITRIFENRVIFPLILTPLLVLIFLTRSVIFKFAHFWQIGGLCLFFGLLIWLGFKFNHKVLRLSLLLLFSLIVVFGLDVASIYDYDYYFAPVLKLLQGEKLGSFYMQYNLGGVLVFGLLMSLGLKIYQMQIFMGILFVIWYVLVYWLSARVVKDQKLRWLLIISLVVVRYFSINHDPIKIPQVQPLRLDLWVIPLLFVSYFGFSSIVTSTAFATIYLLDNTFGFLYVGVYLLGLAYNLKFAIFRKKNLLLLAPILAAALFNLYFFHSFSNPAAKIYQTVQLGLMPIAWNSPFWLIFASLPLVLFLFLKEQDRGIKTFKLLLLGLTLVELIYFYGRSHDHNLLNISGILIFTAFISLDFLASNFKLKRFTYFLGAGFIFLSLILFSGHIVDKLTRFESHLKIGKLYPISSFDTSIDENPGRFNIYPKSAKIFLISQFDSYLNYRYGLVQLGEVVPFSINLYVDKTADLLIKQVRAGTKVVVWEQEMIELINQLNLSAHMRELGLQFELIERNGFRELTLVDVGVLSEYSKNGLSFKFPSSWIVKEEADAVSIIGESDLKIYIKRPAKLVNQSNQEYLAHQESLGKMVNQGLAQIPKMDYAYVKIYSLERDRQLMQFFLFKGDKVVEVRVSPTTTELMRDFDKIIGSLDLN